MGDRETEFLGVPFGWIVSNQELGFSKSHYFSCLIDHNIRHNPSRNAHRNGRAGHRIAFGMQRA
jgi:hypothetical protein